MKISGLSLQQQEDCKRRIYRGRNSSSLVALEMNVIILRINFAQFVLAGAMEFNETRKKDQFLCDSNYPPQFEQRKILKNGYHSSFPY